MIKDLAGCFSIKAILILLFFSFTLPAQSQDLTEAQKQERCKNNKQRISELEIEILQDIHFKEAMLYNNGEYAKIVSDCAIKYNGPESEVNKHCYTELYNFLAKKIDNTLSLQKQTNELLSKKQELHNQLTIHQNNISALGCNKSSATVVGQLNWKILKATGIKTAN